jgi:hypothetical protein
LSHEFAIIKQQPTKKKDHGHENRMELSLNERIEANMLPDPMRDQFIIHEVQVKILFCPFRFQRRSIIQILKNGCRKKQMRFQRHALLGPIAVWKQQIAQYYQDVQMWRSNRNARELMQDVRKPNLLISYGFDFSSLKFQSLF